MTKSFSRPLDSCSIMLFQSYAHEVLRAKQSTTEHGGSNDESRVPSLESSQARTVSSYAFYKDKAIAFNTIATNVFEPMAGMGRLVVDTYDSVTP